MKKIGGIVRRQLLKINWVKLEVEAYRMVQGEKQRHEHWTKTMQDNEVEKSDHKTFAIVTDSGINVDYMDGRMVGQRGVVPVFIDSVQWGGMK